LNIKIDRAKWSKHSQRSTGHYDEHAIYYENIAYRCNKCEKSKTYTAEQQKRDYEDKKDYIWHIPSLCLECESKRNTLTNEASKFQAKWNREREKLSRDKAFLEKWRELLSEIQTYGRKGSHPSNVAMITKLLSKLKEI
jgi:hypothetical protein